jgi:hypothetical protein
MLCTFHRQDQLKPGIAGPHPLNGVRCPLQRHGLDRRAHACQHTEVQRLLVLEGQAVIDPSTLRSPTTRGPGNKAIGFTPPPSTTMRPCGASFTGLHQTTVANDICGKYRGKAALDAFFGHWSSDSKRA